LQKFFGETLTKFKISAKVSKMLKYDNLITLCIIKNIFFHYYNYFPQYSIIRTIIEHTTSKMIGGESLPKALINVNEAQLHK